MITPTTPKKRKTNKKEGQQAIRWEAAFHNCSSGGMSRAWFICWDIFYMKCLPVHMKWAAVVCGGTVVESLCVCVCLWGGVVTTDHCDPARSWLGNPCVFMRRECVCVALPWVNIKRVEFFSASASQTLSADEAEPRPLRFGCSSLYYCSRRMYNNCKCAWVETESDQVAAGLLPFVWPPLCPYSTVLTFLFFNPDITNPESWLYTDIGLIAILSMLLISCVSSSWRSHNQNEGEHQPWLELLSVRELNLN